MKKQFFVVAGIFLFALCDFCSASTLKPNYFDKVAEQIAKRKAGGFFNFSFKSSIDGTVQSLLVKIPKNYDPIKKWPMLVVLHGLGDGPIVVPSIDLMVQIGPYGRGDLRYRGLGEKDVFEAIEIAKKIFTVDDDRIYLTGFSMGADGTFELGLKYPDCWAACVPVCGKLQNLSLIINGKNLPFWIQAGGKDIVVPASLSKSVYELACEQGCNDWDYTEHAEMGHNFNVNWNDVEKWMLKQKKQKKPNSINYWGLKPQKVYWLEVLALEKNNTSFTVEALINDNMIRLNTRNVRSYKIYIKEAPVSPSSAVVVYENGVKIDIQKDKSETVLVRNSELK